MKKVFTVLLSLVLLVAIGTGVVYFFFPAALVTLTQWQAASASGLQDKTVQIDGETVHYFEGGPADAPTVVLLHGMGDDRHSFVPAAQALTGQYRVILPDLRGHGDNAKSATGDHSIAGQVAFLNGFTQQLSLQNFSLGGNSMGGHVSAAYTLAYPEKVTKLMLVNAPGLKLDDHEVYTGFGKKMVTPEDFYAVMDRVFYKRPNLPPPVLQHMIAKTNQDFDFINGLAAAVRNGADYDLKDRIAQIQAPTLVLWGQHDRVVKFNVAEAYASLIPKAQLVLIEDGAHSPQLEKPGEVGLAILTFLNAPGN